MSGNLKTDDTIENKYKCYFDIKQAEYVNTEVSKTVNLKDLYNDTNFNKNYKTKSHIEIDDDTRLYLDERLEVLFEKYRCRD
ncbi:hypothetical protein [Intestinibacter sp.]